MTNDLMEPRFRLALAASELEDREAFLKNEHVSAVQKALEQFGHSVEGKRKAAASLGISLATLYRRIKE